MHYKFEVLTVRDLDFQDQSGKPVSGMQIWVIGETSDPGWNGWEVTKLWISSGSSLESTAAILKRGDLIDVAFNRRGKPETIAIN